ncbi:MAG: deoxyribonuclease IV [Spirochaetes bacterium]|nr:deoxyribonuclease IV [Spirochaetota bacterium]
MKRLGAHVSAAGGVSNAPLNAEKIGAKAFALFLKNQKQWSAPQYDPEEIARFRENCARVQISQKHVLAHDGYLINLGNPDPAKYKMSLDAFLDEMQRCEDLGLSLLNFHPGGHMKQSTEEECLGQIADSINSAHGKTAGVTAVIENTAGQGTSVGHSFEQIAFIIKKVKDKKRVGVCFDTCHAFAAGYDLRTKKACEETFRKFDETIGIKYLKGMHINDSKSEYGSRVDRHHSLKMGNLGKAAFEFIMNDPRFEEMPLILETIDEELWEKEIKWLYSLVKK